METPEEPLVLSPAGEVFARFLEQAESGEAVDFEAICRANPRFEPELRRMHRGWVALGGAVDSESASRDSEEVQRTFTRERIAALRRDAADSTRLKVMGELARGGRGRILEVFDADLGRELAMKTLHEGRGGVDGPLVDPRSMARFLEEARVTGGLGHPGIVPIHELGVDAEGRVYFTMPLVRGDDFRSALERVRSGAWTPVRAIGVLLRVCEAVAFAHSRGVVHRDLKPANILVGPFGETYVIDWGLARTLGSSEDVADADFRSGGVDQGDSPLLTVAGDVLGTPAYMSPEQALGDLERIGPATDVYAVGAMLYELLAGRPPFGGADSTPEEVVERVRAQRPEPLVEVARDAPPELVAICERAMARETGERYASMEDLAEDLRAYTEVRVVRAYKTGAVAELGKWMRRNRGLALALAGLFLALAVGLAFSLSLYFEAQARSQEVVRLAALQDVKALEAETETLWPPHPERSPEFESWIARARTLVERLPEHRAKLAERRSSSGVASEAPVYGSQDSLSSWWDEQLSSLIAGLEGLEAHLMPGELIESSGWTVAERLRLAERLKHQTLENKDVQDRWEAAAIQAKQLYGELKLSPQIGLVPIGADPDHGWLEFWHVASGTEPIRDAAGRVVPSEESGMTFVLIPAGRFHMGSQSEDPDALGFDPRSTPSESPVLEVQLDAFLLSKFELHQGQWVRVMGSNPSSYKAGSNSARHDYNQLNPVEFVTWLEAAEYAKRTGLDLPTEAQWEYACRAGTQTPWNTGVEMASLAGFANVADEGSAPYWNQGWTYLPGLDDGYEQTAPIGSYSPNGFGLHDMHGNVMEWCLDGPARYDKYPPREGDGLRRLAEGHGTAIYRGGAYSSVENSSRASYRGFGPLNANGSDSGIRLARKLRP